ncbi:lycopene cyclase domain-containing protein [Halobium salinum]|uniref:Lycopene cyclase domain-containing protein n=1 Tax=Halobium salinum TaxID=1364940 RepID=A0ABD5PF69_9EURY|nr:lycopene cyclase domain-containing protein [Halobium salinum]
MTPELTYLGFLALALVPPTAVLFVLALRRGRALDRPLVAGTALVTFIGFVYTVPWDNALIARGVWWYGEGVVFATIHLAPVGEYLFILSQPLLTALWLALLRTRDSSADTEGAAATDEVTPSVRVSRRQRLGGAVAGGAVSVVGLAMLAAESTFYLGAILAWAGPVLAVQWAFGWPYLLRHRRRVALAVLVPTAYLAAADRVAIELGLWTISPRFTTGLTVLGLPVEEGAFFLLTNVFVIQGLVLFLWVVERPDAASFRSRSGVAEPVDTAETVEGS